MPRHIRLRAVIALIIAGVVVTTIGFFTTSTVVFVGAAMVALGAVAYGLRQVLHESPPPPTRRYDR
jgi:uncharacterized membrane protein HdeD (DUF308 family)